MAEQATMFVPPHNRTIRIKKYIPYLSRKRGPVIHQVRFTGHQIIAVISSVKAG